MGAWAALLRCSSGVAQRCFYSVYTCHSLSFFWVCWLIYVSFLSEFYLFWVWPASENKNKFISKYGSTNLQPMKIIATPFPDPYCMPSSQLKITFTLLRLESRPTRLPSKCVYRICHASHWCISRKTRQKHHWAAAVYYTPVTRWRVQRM